jgi:hypothetical protein
VNPASWLSAWVLLAAARDHSGHATLALNRARRHSHPLARAMRAASVRLAACSLVMASER